MNSFRFGRYRFDYITPKSKHPRAGWVWFGICSWANIETWWASFHLFPQKEFRIWGLHIDEEVDMNPIYNFGLGPFALFSWAR